MRNVTYSEALEFIKANTGKIRVVVFHVKDCVTCDDFLPDLFNVEIEKRSEHFEVVYVDSASLDVPFPPYGTPTVYFYIPDTEEPMPFIRVGGTTRGVLEKDLDCMIRIKDEKISAFDVFSYHPEEITSWTHRQYRLG